MTSTPLDALSEIRAQDAAILLYLDRIRSASRRSHHAHHHQSHALPDGQSLGSELPGRRGIFRPAGGLIGSRVSQHGGGSVRQLGGHPLAGAGRTSPNMGRNAKRSRHAATTQSAIQEEIRELVHRVAALSAEVDRLAVQQQQAQATYVAGEAQ